MSEMKNTKPERGEQPKYAWPRPGTDAPRVPWADFLRLWATEIDKQIGGGTGTVPGQLAAGTRSSGGGPRGGGPRRARGQGPGGGGPRGGLDPGARGRGRGPRSVDADRGPRLRPGDDRKPGRGSRSGGRRPPGLDR